MIKIENVEIFGWQAAMLVAIQKIIVEIIRINSESILAACNTLNVKLYVKN